jgi:hypothetical protein
MPVPDEVNQTVAAHLRQLSAEELDREYMKEMVAEYSKMVAKFEADARQENDAEIRQWTERQTPIFQNHLQMAQSIHEKLTARAELQLRTRDLTSKHCEGSYLLLIRLKKCHQDNTLGHSLCTR